NHDDLYADILMWADKGWVDYLVPQLYWNLDLQVAPSRHLAEWWNNNVKAPVQLYIGQDTKRTMDVADSRTGAKNELASKIELSRKLKNVGGNVWWHGYWVTDNYKGVRDSLTNHFQRTIALPPAWDNLASANGKPQAPRNLRIIRSHGKTFLEWDAPKVNQREDDAMRFVVYSFLPDESMGNLNNPEAIIALTGFNRVAISDDEDPASIDGLRFAVTALDRLNRESDAATLRR
ncbi:MAG: family 10 glycosylhydrolase, partial [Muribaculaceae bacterium]|nr:family 10 glycosylhydrolase [Muribaculaceae bacterium]